MFNDVVIEKEHYVSKEKTVLLREYILNPHKTVLHKQLNNVNDIVMRLAMNRK
jgi:hypothetical protein